MKSPFTGKDMSIQKELRKINFRKDEFNVLVHFYKCDETGEQFEDQHLSELNYVQLINQYRAKHKIPFPEQIKSIRERYDLSATKMSEILGFGTNVYRQYEAGEVPSQSNARLIQLADDPHEFKKLLGLCGTVDEKLRQRTENKIENILETCKKNKADRWVEQYLFSGYSIDSENGYKMPNMDKIKEMVFYFADKLNPWKTKLNKLLFYTDFLSFKQTGYSISGSRYRAIPMGPGPNNFDSLFEYLSNKQVIQINYMDFENGDTGSQFLPFPGRDFNSDILTKSEHAVLEYVANRFKDTSTKEMIDISHKERAWIDNKDERKIIDYQYSFELSQV